MAKIKPQALLQQSKKKKGPSRIISVSSIAISSLVVLLIVFFLFASYRHWSQRSQIPTHNGRSVLEDNTFLDPKKTDLPRYVTLNTAKGFVIVELFKDSSPDVVNEFIKLCQKGHFSGMLFRRVIKHYVLQAGNTDEPAIIEDWTLGRNSYEQIDTSLKHEAFMLGTPKVKNERRGFELFITTAPIPDLNEKLIVFGRIAKGEDVVQEIEEVDTNEHYQPKSPIEITGVTLHQAM